MPCNFKKFCVVGGGPSCDEGFCDEKNRLSKLETVKCQIMIGLGREGSLRDCDVPFWLRSLIPHNVPCHNGGKCLLGVYFPNLRIKYYGKKNIPDRVEIVHMASLIKSKIRASELTPVKTRVYTSAQLDEIRT